jgi:hypothetical protein
LIVLFGIALSVAFISLVLASQLPSPTWIWALDGVVGGLAVAAFAGIGLIVARVPVKEQWKPLTLPVVAALVSLATHHWLVASLAPTESMPSIDFWRLQLAALSVVGAVFAVLAGVSALNRGRAWYDMAVTGAAVAIGLYSLGPLLIRAGVPVDWRAFVGLVALGLGAFAVIEAARRVRIQ